MPRLKKQYFVGLLEHIDLTGRVFGFDLLQYFGRCVVVTKLAKSITQHKKTNASSSRDSFFTVSRSNDGRNDWRRSIAYMNTAM